jgi:diphosphomevalonate decarboxylase
MQDSNQFHAICQESYPPLFYLNDTSKKIINLIHEFNNKNGLCSGYSFDAGPNAFLLVKTEKLETLKTHLKDFKDQLIITSISGK